VSIADDQFLFYQPFEVTQQGHSRYAARVGHSQKSIPPEAEMVVVRQTKHFEHILSGPIPFNKPEFLAAIFIFICELFGAARAPAGR